MKCYEHSDRDAVAQCQMCGRGLCKECSHEFAPLAICEYCAHEQWQTVQQQERGLRNRYILQLVLSGVLFIAALCVYFASMSHMYTFWQILGMAYVWAGLPAGWSALSKITVNLFLFMPIGSWIIYAIIKFCLSLLIGMFVFPFRTVIAIVQIKKINRNLRM